MHLTESIKEMRQKASKHSLGISHKSIYQKVIGILEKNGHSSGDLLDYGAGKGQFISYLRSKLPQSTFQIHGVDLMDSQVKDAQWYVHDLNQKFFLKENTFDIVTAIEIIEHLENPRNVVRDLYKVLKPNGRLVLTTPNNESMRSMLSFMMRGHFVSFTDTSYPAHITPLNRMDLLRIFNEVGFQDIEFLFTDNGQIPKMTKYTWQGLSMGQLKGLRFSDNLLITAVKPVSN